jgi:hypothetical protein
LNLTYVKNYLEARKENITAQDIDTLIKEIEAYQKTESNFTDIAKIMRTVNEYNLTFITLVEEYQALPNNDIKLLPKKTNKVREILTILSAIHTYLMLSISTIKDSSYELKGIQIYLRELGEKKEHFKSEKVTWATILRSLSQEMSFTQEMRKMDIEDKVGYIKWQGS